MPAPGGGLVPGGAWSQGGGFGPGGSGPGGGACSRGCLVETPQTSTAAGGTHPTGMHSCLSYICYYIEHTYLYGRCRIGRFYIEHVIVSLQSVQ